MNLLFGALEELSIVRKPEGIEYEEIKSRIPKRLKVVHHKSGGRDGT
jgi:hypothetical protein